MSETSEPSTEPREDAGTLTEVSHVLTPPPGAEPTCPKCEAKASEIRLGACGEHAGLHPCGCVLTKGELLALLGGGGGR